MNIDEMPAGRELDALVSEKVMGCKPVKGQPGWGDIVCGCEPRVEAHETGDTGCIQCGGVVFIPNYSTEIAAAWEVAEKFRRYMLHRAPPAYKEPLPYLCQIEIENGKYFNAWADTAPLAIVRAALKAVGL